MMLNSLGVLNNNNGSGSVGYSDYYSNPAMSQSKLQDLKKSPKHFYTKHLSPFKVDSVETEAMKFGKAVHMNLFEHQLFMNRYIEDLDIDKRTVMGKKLYTEFLSQNFNKVNLSHEDMLAIKSIRDAVLNKKTFRFLFNQGGFAEKELFWIDTDTGIRCKAKLDYLIEPCKLFPNGLIIDLKTTMNARSSEFIKSIYNFGYYNQLAFYSNAVKTIYKTESYPTFIFIPVEKFAPYECSFLAGDEMMLKIGLKENLDLLRLYSFCMENDKWYGYEDKIQKIGLPQWIIHKFGLDEIK